MFVPIIGWTEAAVTHARKGHANRRKIQLDASKLVDILPQCRIGSEADVNPIPEGSLSTIFGIHASKIIKRQLFSHSQMPFTFKAVGGRGERPRKNTKSGKNDLSPLPRKRFKVICFPGEINFHVHALFLPPKWPSDLRSSNLRSNRPLGFSLRPAAVESMSTSRGFIPCSAA